MASTKEKKAEIVEAAFRAMACFFERIPTQSNEAIIYRFGNNGVENFAFLSIFDTSMFARVVYNSQALDEDKITKSEFHDMVAMYENLFGTVFDADDKVIETETADGNYVLVLDRQLWNINYDDILERKSLRRKSNEAVIITLVATQLSYMINKLLGGRRAINVTRDRVTGEFGDKFISRQHLLSSAIDMIAIDDGVLTLYDRIANNHWLAYGEHYYLPLTLMSFNTRCKFSATGIAEHAANSEQLNNLLSDFDGSIDYCLLDEVDNLSLIQAAFNTSEKSRSIKDDPNNIKHGYFLRVTANNYLDNIDRIFSSVSSMQSGLELIKFKPLKHTTENNSKWSTGTLSANHFTVDASKTTRPS